MKKALFTLMMFCFICGVIGYFPCKASSYTEVASLNFESSSDKAFLLLDTIPQDIEFSYDSKNFKKCVGLKEIQGNSTSITLIFYPTENGCLFDGSYYSSSFGKYYTSAYLSSIDLYAIPFFNNIDDASNYSMGLDYNSSNMVGGSIPITWGFDSSETYNVVPKHFEKNFNFSSNGQTWNKDVAFTIKSWIVNPSDIPSGYEIMYDINMTYPASTWLDAVYSTMYGNELPTSVGLAMGIVSNFRGGVSALLDGVTNVTNTFTYDFDWMAQQSAYENYLTLSYAFNQDWQDRKGEQTIILKEVITDNIFGNNSYCPNGFVSQLASYYGDYQKACFALPYINVNWVACYVIDPTTGRVFDYYNTYYVDSIKSDGVVFEHKGFNTQNNIDNVDIGEPSSSDTTIPSGTPKVTIPSSEMQSSYVSSIQDSYNNVTNNYYYNNNYNQDLLDYLNRYKDGGSQEDIEDAFGYLDSTLDSLSNVPLLLGKLFNGFFPPTVVILLSAMFVIFVVFLIIRIIKHLFL